MNTNIAQKFSYNLYQSKDKGVGEKGNGMCVFSKNIKMLKSFPAKLVKTSMVLLTLAFTLSHAQQSIAQSCDYQTGIVTFNASGQNITDLYQTDYLLTNAQGDIIAISQVTEFSIDVQGFYLIYGVNYKLESTIEGLSVGSNVNAIGGDCLDISTPMPITVCEALDPCNYCLGETIVLMASGGNTGTDVITKYVLTDQMGVISVVQDTPDFGLLDEGLYVAFAVNYDSQEDMIGLEVGQNIYDIESICKDISDGFVIGVCQALNPSIFFDLKGCDITQTALLQVGEEYDSYEWSTGSTQSFIEVDANTPATYRVTVTLASGCIGIKEQEITGEEVAQIGDYVWEDSNGDGLQGTDESGINGVTVNLYADFNRDGRPDFADFPSCITTTRNHPTTGEPGYYNFNVYQSSYIVGFEGPNGFTISPQSSGNDPSIDSDPNPATGLTNTINVTPGQIITDIDAGFFTSSSIGGTVWNDLNGNGVQEEGEEGIDDVVINLYDANGMLIATTVTATDPVTGEVGAYCFEGVAPAGHYTEIILPDGFVLSPADRRADDDIDSDANGDNGLNTTPIYNLSPGEKQDNVDFGTYLGGRICGLVWKEGGTSDNGVYDPGIDEPIADSELELISIDNNNQVIDVVSTNANGEYCFDGVPMGSYRVRPRTGSGSDSYVSIYQGDDPLLDSDIDPNTLTTEVFFLNPSEEIFGVNAGLRFGTVPVQLVSFTGEWNRNKDINVLSWSTASEINNDKFIIERVIGNSGKFEAIGEVAGNGTSTDVVSYTFEDSDISLSASYYYRLKQVDYDGGFEYSDIIVIDIERNGSVAVNLYPNPATDFITVALDIQESAVYSAKLVSLTGQVVAGWDGQKIQKGNNYTTIDVADVPMGQYLLSLTVGTQTVTHKILITK